MENVAQSKFKGYDTKMEKTEEKVSIKAKYINK